MKKILFIGYGIGGSRNEAVSVNVNKYVNMLRKNNICTRVVSIGLPVENKFYFGNSMLDAVLNRNKILKNLNLIIKKYRITHVHDVFVLPFTSYLFTLPLKDMNPGLKIIKEVFNSYGSSTVFHKETFIRFVANSKYFFNKITKISDVLYSRSNVLAKEMKILYLPPFERIYKYRERTSGKILNICYLGHPLRKKGVYMFPKIFSKVNEKIRNRIKINFSFSEIGGEKEKFEQLLRNSAKKNNLPIKFFNKTKPRLFFRKNDLFILPLQDEYGAIAFPNTILEAMEAGCVVMTTDTVSIREILQNNKTGILITPPLVDNILKNLNRLIDDQKILRVISLNAREEMLKKYNYSLNYLLFIKMYE